MWPITTALARQTPPPCGLSSTQTVTAAARRLNMSQPAATQMLAGLERSVGFALFARDRRRLVPTNEALTFYAEVRRAFVGLDMLRSFAKETRDLQRGHIVAHGGGGQVQPGVF